MEREMFIEGFAHELQHTWMFSIDARMKVCPDKKGKPQWCWTPYTGNYSHYQWAQILLKIWRRLPASPSAFVSYYQNDHRPQLKDK
jgi:hypothetical protein